MLNWIESHEVVLGLALQALTALIWVVYLQLILIGVIRQRRPVILIHRSAGMGDDARCFVSNMGAEPIYLLILRAELTIDGERRHAFITDRDEITREDLPSSDKGTAQGPIDSGGLVDIGNFGDLVWRAQRSLGLDDPRPTDLRLTALCLAGRSENLVAAYRDFRIRSKGGVRAFIPVQATTRQIKSPFRRAALRKIVRTALAEEAAAYED